jgi:hypothetical protein
MTAATAAPTIATTTAALRLRPCFVDVHGATLKLRAIQAGDCRLRLALVRHLDEREPPRLTGVTIGDHADALNRAVWRECRRQIILRGLEIEITYEYLGHLLLLVLLMFGTRALDLGLLNNRTRRSGTEEARESTAGKAETLIQSQYNSPGSSFNPGRFEFCLFRHLVEGF